MLRMVQRVHRCSASAGEHLTQISRSLAIAAAFLLIQSQPLSALQAETNQPAPVPSAQTSTVAPQAVAAPEMAAVASAEFAGTNDVDVQVEVVPGEQKGDSKLLVQLDGDQASTAVAGQAPTVSDLAPGVHTARLILMDREHRPVQGGTTTLHFRVHATPVNGASKSADPAQELRGAAPAPPPIPDELRDDADPSFSLKGSPLPIIALIGFLLLVGGFLPPMRARKVTRIVHP